MTSPCFYTVSFFEITFFISWISYDKLIALSYHKNDNDLEGKVCQNSIRPSQLLTASFSRFFRLLSLVNSGWTLFIFLHCVILLLSLLYHQFCLPNFTQMSCYYADITLYNCDKERLCLRQLLSRFYGKLICLELDIKYIVYRDWCLTPAAHFSKTQDNYRVQKDVLCFLWLPLRSKFF